MAADGRRWWMRVRRGGGGESRRWVVVRRGGGSDRVGKQSDSMWMALSLLSTSVFCDLAPVVEAQQTVETGHFEAAPPPAQPRPRLQEARRPMAHQSVTWKAIRPPNLRPSDWRCCIFYSVLELHRLI